ncbi:uncharacterized protein ACA1_176190, partial [Acanthamoeba castellanii str. Neff]
MEAVHLGPNCSFKHLLQAVATARETQGVAKDSTLVDTSGALLTEEWWDRAAPRLAILREKGAPIDIKSKANITPVPNIISSFIVDIQPL